MIESNVSESRARFWWLGEKHLRRLTVGITFGSGLILVASSLFAAAAVASGWSFQTLVLALMSLALLGTSLFFTYSMIQSHLTYLKIEDTVKRSQESLQAEVDKLVASSNLLADRMKEYTPPGQE